MDRLPLPEVRVDLRQIARNVAAIRSRTGAAVLAVVKCDAYGCGAREVVRAIAGVADGLVFNALHEVADCDARETGLDSLTLSVPLGGAGAYAEHLARPAVWTVEDAAAYRSTGPVLNIDTGMQRFSCPGERVDEVASAGNCAEAMTHATAVAHIERFLEIAGDRFPRRHVAGSALLGEPRAWLTAVRPGLAIYENAVTVTTPLIDVRKTTGPAGYGGFEAQWHGVIPMGYAHGLRPGPCRIGGRESRVIEVGMQSAFVLLRGDERPGDRVTIVGDGVTPQDLSKAWGVSPQEVLVRLGRSGKRVYAT